jgi:uncharacterized protein with FMN-binding domain
MKKFIIGLFVLGTYGIYSIGIRHVRPVLSKPSILTKKTNPSTYTYAKTMAKKTPGYRDGTYIGNVEYEYYGNVQAAVTITAGKINNVKFLQYPNSHSTSVYINDQVMPYLKQEAIKTQSAKNVQIISGATFTSVGFIKSLQSALAKA